MSTASGSLGDDLEVLILARVPCHMTLLNALYAKKAWRERLYSPKFRRQFCSMLSAPPLLGFFCNDSPQESTVPMFPSFIITRDCDPKINAIVEKGDFFLTKVLNSSSESVCWEICDCIDGLLLLMDPLEGILVVYNPMTSWSSGFFQDFENTAVEHQFATQYSPRLVRSDGNPNSFHVIVLLVDPAGTRVRTVVFSSTEMNWSVNPWQQVAQIGWLPFKDIGSIGNRSLYWGDVGRTSLLILDKASMEFSTIRLPGELQSADFAPPSRNPVCYGFGEVEGGKSCIVASQGTYLVVFVRGSDPNGVERWVLRNSVNLADQLRELLPKDRDDEDDHLVTDFVFHGIIHETVFFDALYSGSFGEPHWCLSMRLDTMKLQKLFRNSRLDKYPYFIGWPSSNIDNWVD
jgi:hypothetical protein